MPSATLSPPVLSEWWRTSSSATNDAAETALEYTLPALSLDRDGMALHFEAWGDRGTGASNLEVKFGGTSLFIDASGAGEFRVFGTIVRTGSSSQRCCVPNAYGASTSVYKLDWKDTALDLTASQVLRVECTAANSTIRLLRVYRGGAP